MAEQTTEERPQIGSEPGTRKENDREEEGVMDLSRLDDQLDEAGIEGPGKRAAFAFYRNGVISGPPSLDAVAEMVREAPKNDCLNVDGVGPAGYEMLAEMLTHDQTDEASGTESDIGKAPRRESTEGVRVLDRRRRPEEAEDPGVEADEATEPPIQPATDRADVQRRRDLAREGSRLIRPVHRSRHSEMAPECPQCGSDMVCNGTNRGESDEKTIRYWKCLAKPHDADHRRQTVHED